MIVTIHQPEHLIWLGLVDKISRADKFVILDNVQFEKQNFQNRNKIRSNNKEGWSWLTVPLAKQSHGTKIKDAEISYSHDWIKKYLNLLESNYRRGQFFHDYYKDIKEIILEKNKYLADLNIKLIKLILKAFDMDDKKIVRASELNLPDSKGGTNVNLEICKFFDAKQYLSGPSGKSYLDLGPFESNNIDVIFHEFKHPAYKQLFEGFMPGMSSVDLLFNCGPESKKILEEAQNVAEINADIDKKM